MCYCKQRLTTRLLDLIAVPGIGIFAFNTRIFVKKTEMSYVTLIVFQDLINYFGSKDLIELTKEQKLLID